MPKKTFRVRLEPPDLLDYTITTEGDEQEALGEFMHANLYLTEPTIELTGYIIDIMMFPWDDTQEREMDLHGKFVGPDFKFEDGIYINQNT